MNDNLFMTPNTAAALSEALPSLTTPCYVYMLDAMLAHIDRVSIAFQSRFSISYAIKSNPNATLLQRLGAHIDWLDASSVGEIETALEAGYPPSKISFSGPAKRLFELQRAVELPGLKIVCESVAEMQALHTLADASNRQVDILIRINPLKVPRSFGINMAGAASPFGIDEETLQTAATELKNLPRLTLRGFHAYSATNSLNIAAIDENFSIYIALFTKAADIFSIHPEYLIFGAGFGIPYTAQDAGMREDELATKILHRMESLDDISTLKSSHCILESGRYLVGPYGYFLTQVVGRKLSRGTEICICDGGMNNHLAACGLMGMFLRRPWLMWNLSADHEQPLKKFTITGPLCTTIDTLGRNAELSAPEVGHVIAVGSSGAYGPSASPVNFISHPHPHEYLIEQGKIIPC